MLENKNVRGIEDWPEEDKEIINEGLVLMHLHRRIELHAAGAQGCVETNSGADVTNDRFFVGGTGGSRSRLAKETNGRHRGTAAGQKGASIQSHGSATHRIPERCRDHQKASHSISRWRPGAPRRFGKHRARRSAGAGKS